MDVTVGPVGIAAIKVICIDPGASAVISELGLNLPDPLPMFVLWAAATVVVDAADHKVQIISTRILFELFDQFYKALFINFG